MSTLHIVVAMKPLEGNFVQNALEHGVAGINVDGCRIGFENGDTTGSAASAGKGCGAKSEVYGQAISIVSPPHKLGRWPSNVILGHLEGCKKVGMKKVKSSKLDQNINRSSSDSRSIGKQTDGHCIGYGDDDGKETVEAWECQEGCLVKAMDEQSGNKCGASAPVKGTESSETGQNGIYGKYNRVASAFSNDGFGGASRFFKHVKEE